MKIIPSISKPVKETMVGGIIGGLAVNIEAGLSWFVAGYPQILKNKLNPSLTRNGALLANIAPAGVAYAVTRKGRGSARSQNMKNGILFYDFPKLLDQIVYNFAYQAGLPAQGLARSRFVQNFGMNGSRPIPTMLNRPMVVTSSGKYGLAGSANRSVGSGVGRYRGA